MRTRPLATALMIALVPMAFAVPSRGQSSGDDATTAVARARFKEGVEFYDKGEYEQARAAFLQAYALKKHPAVLLNLAWSCLKSGHALEGERYFKQFLVEGREITDKQRADASDGLAQTHAKLGRIEVVAPAGTEVMVDGDRAGATPLVEPVSVEAGAHTVKFKANDGTTDTESVSVLGGEKAVARFVRPVAAAAPPVAATPPPGQAAEEAPAATPPAPSEAAEQSRKKESASAKSKSKPSIFAAPDNMAPIYVGVVLTAAGVGTAIVASVFKGQAQSNAESLLSQIKQNGGTSCTPPRPATPPFTRACQILVDDNNQIDQDGLAVYIGAGVAVAASVGTFVYWLASDKQPEAVHIAATAPMLVPVIGKSGGGLSLSGTF